MPYTIINAIQDEISLLKDMESWAERNDKLFVKNMYGVNRQCFEHIVQRMQGYNFQLAVNKDGEEYIGRSKSDRKTLEEEFPALKKAAEQYDIIEKLVDSTPDD